MVVVGDFGNLGALLGIVGAFRVSLGFWYDVALISI